MNYHGFNSIYLPTYRKILVASCQGSSSVSCHSAVIAVAEGRVTEILGEAANCVLTQLNGVNILNLTTNMKMRHSSVRRQINRLTPNDTYMGRTAPLTSKRFILYIYSTNISTEYFKHALYSPFFSLQNAVCFIMLTCLVPVVFTFYIQDVLKLKK